ncbi:MAG: DUF6057 family protein [Sedimentisphaerales bacterium]|jgi:hypothetical protein
MMRLLRKLLGGIAGEGSISSLFFALYYLYLWLVVDLRLIYHGGMEMNFPVFYRGWPFFEKFISYPAGPAEYIASFLSQLFHIGWLGAIVATVLAWSIYVCSDSIVRMIGAPRLRWVCFIPPILFLVLYILYIHHLVITVALLTALLFTNLYLRIVPKSGWYSLIVFVALSAILYYITGGVYLVFVSFCAIYELFFARRPRTGLLYLLLAAVIPYVEGVLLLGVSINETFSNLLPFSWKFSFSGLSLQPLIIFYILYLFLPLMVLGWGLRAVFVGSWAGQSSDRPGRADGDSSEAKKTTAEESRSGIFSRVIESRLLFVVIFFAALFTYDCPLKAVLAVDYYEYEKKWPEVLSAVGNHPDSNVAAYKASHALYHAGRLGYDMFRYPQRPNDPFLTTDRYILAHWLRFDTYIELGYINLAEHELMKSMEGNGERPAFLKRLALINMVKGENGMARVFLGALNRTLFDAGWARNYLEKMERDPNLSTDEEVQYLRSLMPKRDRRGNISKTSVNMYLDLLDSNRHNRMAFEYLMAHYLLTRQLDKFVEQIGRLNDFNYPEIPRLYEEAILVYTSRTHKSVELYGRRISPESRQRVKGFEEVLGHYMGDKDAAFNELSKDYGDSYLFYFVYGFSEVKK